MQLKVEIKGTAGNGLHYPIGAVTEFLYRIIDYLEPLDMETGRLRFAVPIEKKFKDLYYTASVYIEEDA